MTYEDIPGGREYLKRNRDEYPDSFGLATSFRNTFFQMFFQKRGEIFKENDVWVYEVLFGKEEELQKEYRKYLRVYATVMGWNGRVSEIPGFHEWRETPDNAHWPEFPNEQLSKIMEEGKGEVSGDYGDWLYEVVFEGKI